MIQLFLLIFFVGFDGQASLDGPIEEIARVEAKEAEFALNALGIVVYSILQLYLGNYYVFIYL